MASRHFSFKTGKAGRGAPHADYIAGEQKYARDDVRLTIDANVPTWATDARDFFDAADRLERANGRAYSEIEFAIPRDCPDPESYAVDYAKITLGDRHVYRLAVHDKPAADGGRNIHGHLMFSERKLDGIERTREQFFKRANSKNPEKGGAAKDRTWNDRQHIETLRRGYEQHAAKHGVTLDLRSNEKQGLGAPEKKLGPEHPRAEYNDARADRARDVESLRQGRLAAVRLRQELAAVEKEIQHEREFRARPPGPMRNLSDLTVRTLTPAPTPAPTPTPQVQAWRERLTEQRQHWQRVGIYADAPKAAGKPTVHRWSNGNAKGLAAVIDYGDRLKPAGDPTKVSDAKIKAIVQLAKEKKWTSITLSGPEDFRQRAALEAFAKGVKVADPDLQKYVMDVRYEQAKEKARIELEQAKADVKAGKLTPENVREYRTNAKPEQRVDAYQAHEIEEAARQKPAPTPAPTPAPVAQDEIRKGVEEAKRAAAEYKEMRAGIEEARRAAAEYKAQQEAARERAAERTASRGRSRGGPGADDGFGF